MKILVIHNTYQVQGGEDSVVKHEVELLRRNGHEVIVYLVSNDEIRSWYSKLCAVLNVVFSVPSYIAVRKLLRRIGPNVVHVHNFFPLLSPSVFYACKALHVPTVMTLHNYRILCPTALMLHDGKITERSLVHGPWWAVGKRAYRNSWIGTFALAAMISVHRWLGTWTRKVDRLIVLTEFSKGIFLRAGLPAENVVVKPNFIPWKEEPPGEERNGLLFVGRLSPEKGVNVLVEAASHLKGVCVCVIGTGPLAEQLRERPLPCFRLLGACSQSEIAAEMTRSVALLVPSIWYEGLPMVVLEAFSSGLPVIASDIGSLSELIEDGVTGLLFAPGDSKDMALKMAWALSHPTEMARMGRAARQQYISRYTPDRNYLELNGIYYDAIDSSRR